MLKLMNRKRGFTLIELMIVVMIIGVLLGIALPNMSVARKRTRTKACVENLNKIEAATEAWAMATSRIDEAPMGVLWPTYIQREPRCPSGGSYGHFCRVGHVPNCSVHGPALNARDEP